MKKLLKTMSILFIVFSVFAALFCSAKTEAKSAYQILNDGLYVLEGVVTVEKGEMTSGTIEEMNTTWHGSLMR